MIMNSLSHIEDDVDAKNQNYVYYRPEYEKARNSPEIKALGTVSRMETSGIFKDHENNEHHYWRTRDIEMEWSPYETLQDYL